MDFGDRKTVVLRTDARGALSDIYQAIFVAVYERSQQDATHQRKDGRIGADAERQCEDYGAGQPRSARQRVDRKSEIANKGHGSPLSRQSSNARAKFGRRIISQL